VNLFDGRLGFDAQAWGTAHFYGFTSVGVSSNDATFERAIALASLTGRVGAMGGWQNGRFSLAAAVRILARLAVTHARIGSASGHCPWPMAQASRTAVLLLHEHRFACGVLAVSQHS
jgi:hypothetical protein